MNLLKYIIKHKEHLRECIEGTCKCDICHDALYYIRQFLKEIDK